MICELCGADAPTKVCSRCGARFCEECGSEEENVCMDCAEEDYEEEVEEKEKEEERREEQELED